MCWDERSGDSLFVIWAGLSSITISLTIPISFVMSYNLLKMSTAMCIKRWKVFINKKNNKATDVNSCGPIQVPLEQHKNNRIYLYIIFQIANKNIFALCFNCTLHA